MRRAKAVFTLAVCSKAKSLRRDPRVLVGKGRVAIVTAPYPGGSVSLLHVGRVPIILEALHTVYVGRVPIILEALHRLDIRPRGRTLHHVELVAVLGKIIAPGPTSLAPSLAI